MWRHPNHNDTASPLFSMFALLLGQACVVKGVSPRKILELNGSIPGVTVGNLLYCDRGLRCDRYDKPWPVLVNTVERERACT